MLAQMEVYHIREMREKQGKGLREIARETGYAFKTVKKYADKEDFSEEKPKRKKGSKLDPYKPEIDQWLEEDTKVRKKQRHTAVKVYNRLKSAYKDFPVGERTVRSYVRAKKRAMNSETGYIKLSHPGGEAQVDFGRADFPENGKTVKLSFLLMTYPHSNGAYAQVFKGENLECFLEGMKRVFIHTKKVLEKIWMDNLKPVVRKILNVERREVSDRFMNFSMHYGFESAFCNVNSGNEKGNVENKVGYTRRNLFVPQVEIEDIEAYNERLLALCEKDMERAHYLKGERIRPLFEEEKRKMKKTNETPYEVFKLEKAKADKYGMVHFENNTYSVFPGHAQTPVWLKVTTFKVEIQDESYRRITEHERLYGKKRESINWYPYLELICQRPRALTYSGFFRELPDNWRSYFENCEYHEKKDSLKVLAEILREKDMEMAETVLEESLKNEYCTSQEIRLTYRRLNQKGEEEYQTGDKWPKMESYAVNLSPYDRLTGGRP